jgi:kinesin family protein 5
LSALGNVINALTDGHSKHIPYRSSTLTRILQDSLGGNSKTSLIVTCSPSYYNLLETVGTLRFGQRAKCIKNTPKVNKEHTVEELIKLLEESEASNSKLKGRVSYLEKILLDHGVHFEMDHLAQVEETGFPESRGSRRDTNLAFFFDKESKETQTVEDPLKSKLAELESEHHKVLQKLEVLAFDHESLKAEAEEHEKEAQFLRENLESMVLDQMKCKESHRREVNST